MLRIFWPSDALKTKDQGVIIGWQNGDLDVLVVTVLQDVEVRQPGATIQTPLDS